MCFFYRGQGPLDNAESSRALWPFQDTVGWWRAVAGLLVLPMTAFLHNRIFFPGMCMLNRIGPEYDAPTIALWLSRDPSLPIAVALSVAVYAAGRRWPAVRSFVAPALVASLPLVIWIWDIPFTRRIVCDSFHDGRLMIAGVVVSTGWIYLLSFVLYLMLLLIKRAPNPAAARR
jgi:hypothetical protein